VADPAPAFRVAIVHANRGTTLDIAGEVDMATAPELGARLEAVIDASTGEVTLDVTEVQFLDSTGLIVLVTAHRRLGAAGRRLIVRNPSAQLDRVFELSGVADVLEVQRMTASSAGD